jgi:hypothetical protein
MTEAEWLACDDPDALLDHLTNTPVSPRKKRLLACGCCRLIWDLLDESSRQAVIVSERFADGLADAAELERAARTAQAAWEERGQRLQGWMTDNSLWQPPRTPEGERLNTEYQAAFAAMQAAWPRMETGAARPREECYDRAAFLQFHWIGPKLASTAAYAARKMMPVEWPTLPLVRDLFGHPFRQPAIDPTWLAWNCAGTPKLAQAIYEEHCFGDLPILADALEEAGCTDAEILTHCRGPGPHARGCWVLDLILGKT